MNWRSRPRDQREVAHAYGVYGTPGAILIRAPNGDVGSPAALGAAAIMALLARTVEMPKAGDEKKSAPELPHFHRAEHHIQA